MKRYSIFQVQLAEFAMAPSTPPPTVQPIMVLVWLNAQLQIAGLQPGKVSKKDPEVLIPPYARPPVPYSSRFGLTSTPNRPRTVPNQRISELTFPLPKAVGSIVTISYV